MDIIPCSRCGFGGKPVARHIISYTSAAEKDSALEDFAATKGSVLIGPSVDRGVDLPDDLCRVIIICKVPFPYLKDKQVSARLYGKGGSIWYAVQTIRTIVQMTGRGVRHEGDWCVSYVLDRQFVDNVWYRHKRLVPKWWQEGIVWAMKGLDNGKVGQ